MIITINRKELINAPTIGGATEGIAKAVPILNFTKITHIKQIVLT
jgi:hypothetical protein